MNSGVKKPDEDNITKTHEDLFATEYNYTKYILMLIPIYLSCLFFVFLDGSFLGMLKIISGYTVVFSLFILSSEEMYLHIKENVIRLLCIYSLIIGMFLIGGIVFYFMDLSIIETSYNIQSLLGIKFNPLHFLMGFTYKIVFSAFLMMVTFWINILILALLIKFNVANKMLQGFKSE